MSARERWHARVPAHVRQQCRGPVEHAVILSLYTYASAAGLVRIGVRQLAAEIGCHPETAQLAIARLRDRGLIELAAPGSGRRAATWQLSTALVVTGSSGRNVGRSDRITPPVATGSSGQSQILTRHAAVDDGCGACQVCHLGVGNAVHTLPAAGHG